MRAARCSLCANRRPCPKRSTPKLPRCPSLSRRRIRARTRDRNQLLPMPASGVLHLARCRSSAASRLRLPALREPIRAKAPAFSGICPVSSGVAANEPIPRRSAIGLRAVNRRCQVVKLPMKRFDGLKARQRAARGLLFGFEPRANMALARHRAAAESSACLAGKPQRRRARPGARRRHTAPPGCLHAPGGTSAQRGSGRHADTQAGKSAAGIGRAMP